MPLTFSRPICFFDLETTGLQITKDRIVQIAIVKWNPDGSEENRNFIVNPGIPIPEEITKIHGITNEMAKAAPKLEDIAQDLIEFFGDSDLAGYNSNKFDIPFMVEEFYRIGKPIDMANRNFIDVQNIFHKMEQRTLIAAYQFYCGKTMENAHNALYDTQVTLEVFKAQIDRYKELPDTVQDVAAFSRNSPMGMVDFASRLVKNEQDEVQYNFGKHKGKSVEAVMAIEPGYFGWMLDADFPFQTKDCLRAEVARIKEKKGQSKQEGFKNQLDALASKFNKK